MSRTLRLEAFYPFAPDLVWVALTEPAAIAEWMMANDFKAKVGHQFRFHVDPQPGFNGIIEGEVTVVEPARRLEYTFQGLGSSVATVVNFTLDAEGDGTRVVLEHSGFDGFRGWALAKILGSGWAKMIPGPLGAVIANVREGEFVRGAVPAAKRTYTAHKVPANYETSPDAASR